MRLVMGLGNPGREYARSRHNAGWMVLDRFAEKHGVAFRRPCLKSYQSAKCAIEGAGSVLLVKPLTYMNCSGDILPSLMRKGGLTAKDLVVVVDDVHIPAGSLRIRAQGSAGGHNGLKSVIERAGSDQFVRIRVGVGEREEGKSLTDHVLERMDAGAFRTLAETADRAAEALDCLLAEGVEPAMNRYNG